MEISKDSTSIKSLLPKNAGRHVEYQPKESVKSENKEEEIKVGSKIEEEVKKSPEIKEHVQIEYDSEWLAITKAAHPDLPTDEKAEYFHGIIKSFIQKKEKGEFDISKLQSKIAEYKALFKEKLAAKVS